MHERAMETLGELTTNLAEAEMELKKTEDILSQAQDSYNNAFRMRNKAEAELEAHKLLINTK